MSKKNYAQTKMRGGKERFAGIPHKIMETEKYTTLNHASVRILLEIVRQYSGFNNGNFCITLSMMRKRGIRSSGTINKALQELQEVGFIELTRQGGRHRCSLYAITWQNIDECNGKLDVAPTRVASGKWRDGH